MALDFELHPDRLTTTDARGRRVFVYPADVRGFFRQRRTLVQSVLMLIFLLLPWLRIDGRQALLLDTANRQFEIFGLSLRAHNAPLLVLVFAIAAFGLFFATSVFGRVWCGWACPQTVFIDAVYRRIERWIEGPASARKKNETAPWNLNKFMRFALKWMAYIAVTLVITHSFMAYFVGTEHLREMMSHRPSENWTSFLFMAISSAIILFDFAWFREQFCTIVCPYGRLQSVLMDPGSLVVSYDVSRGEPRATPQAKALVRNHGGSLGDCVNCYRCVQVCPTGIDIRRGVQMECVACTSCIDACDEVMTKLKKPTGLIRYDSLVPKSRKRMTYRSLFYLSACVLAGIVLVFLLATMKPVSIEVLRAKDTPYTVTTDSSGATVVTNHFYLELSNQSGSGHQLLFIVGDGFETQGVQLVTALEPFPIAEGHVARADIFLRFPKSLLSNGQKKITLHIKDKSQTSEHVIDIEKEVVLVGPFS